MQWEAHCAGQKVMAVCGNYRSRLVAPAQPDFGPWPSFGYNVQQLRPERIVAAVNIVFQSGMFFNGEVKQFNSGAAPFINAAEMRRPGSLGHTADLCLPHAVPVTFLSPPP